VVGNAYFAVILNRSIEKSGNEVDLEAVENMGVVPIFPIFP
jgi:hypothetical protein